MLRPWLAALLACGLLVFGQPRIAGQAPQRPTAGAADHSGTRIRVLAWNVSGDSFVRDPASFRALLTKADADILLLDEVLPSVTETELRAVLAGRSQPVDDQWHISIGRSGGRQRGVIASRLPFEPVTELSEVVPYPSAERERIHARMVEGKSDHPGYAMDGGIPVNGAIVTTGTRQLLVVTVDLQCCGGDPASWEEDRRVVETREIRSRVAQVLARTSVDGVIVAGDLNLVSTGVPMLTLAGPYPLPHGGLIAADLRQLDGVDLWTWDGRGTPFPSRPMDFVFYSPRSLKLHSGFILDSADLDRTELERLKLAADASGKLSQHLPVVAEFAWQ
jgi:endonuclease/exonuclease/phosphatase family metal-dependent hydrolase